ncbi:hypothetical protein Sjap_021845 [Stephania japonica]|uniref:Uncharacterized protein n=1 Tax=Stephania japonica TaxID=461633 RepID=A0AAP0ETG3_9MAGN
MLESTNWIFGEEIEASKHRSKNSLGNLLIGIVVVCVGQLSADPGTSKSKGKKSYGHGSSDDVSGDMTGAAGLTNERRGSQDDLGKLGP